MRWFFWAVVLMFFLAPEVVAAESVTKKVMVLDFNPIIENRGGVRVRQLRGWNDPKILEKQYIEDMKKLSGGYLNYEIVERIDDIDNIYEKLDGFKYTDETYLRAADDDRYAHKPDVINYPKLLKDYGICDKVNKGEIDELWMWGGPWMGYKEAVMAGKNAVYTNGSPITDSSCQRGLHIMGFSYHGYLSEMLEDFIHRTEGTMEVVYTDGFGGMSNWGKFSAYDQMRPGEAGCGWAHYPPNGESGYDWGNPKTVVNSCDDWANYPNMTGAKKTFGCERWGCNGLGFKRWWLSNLPRAGGLGLDNYLANWWKYVADWDIARTTIPLTPYLHRDGRNWCTNHGGIAMKVDHDVYGWLDCLAWCDQNMSAKLPLCQSNADGLRSCWINYPPGGRNGRVENCQWSNSTPPFGGWFIGFETITPTLIPTSTPKPEPPTPFIVLGDADNDGKVDLDDLKAWKTEYLGGPGLTADFDKSGVVDMTDLRVWKTGYLSR